MINSRTLITLIASAFTAQFSLAQGTIDIFMLRSSADMNFDVKTTDKGWGGGMAMMCRPLHVFPETSPFHFNVQLGGNLFVSGFGHKTFKNVPLSQGGEAKVRMANTLMGLNGILRFTYPREGGLAVPYADVFGGLRNIAGGMMIKPENPMPGYENKTSDDIQRAPVLNYGAGAGLLYKINESLNLDIGFMWSTTKQSGQIINLAATHRENDQVSYVLKPMPRDVYMLKVGLVATMAKWQKGGWRKTETEQEHERNKQEPNIVPAPKPKKNSIGTQAPKPIVK